MAGNRLSSTERRREVLDATLRIIQEGGYANLTIRGISNEIEVSEAAIYRHFDSKEEILNDLSTRIFEKTRVSIDKDERGDEFKILARAMERKLSILEENPYFTAVLFQEELFREYPTVKEQFDNHREKNEGSLIEIVEKGVDRGIFSNDVDPETFTELYMGAIRMSVLKWRHDGFSYSLRNKGKVIMKELFKILKKGDDG